MRRRSPWAVATLMAVAIALAPAFVRPLLAGSPAATRHASTAASTSDRARQDAIRSIPLEKLAPTDRAKVNGVLSNVSVFRRLPLKTIDCDPDMYLFLVRHPDVVVNIWEVLKASRLQLWQIGDGRFAIEEPAGASGSLSYVYRSNDKHVIYLEGTYEGPLLPRPVKGRGVLVLKTGYERESNDRYYVTSRVDCLLSVGPAGVELLTKTIAPLLGQTADSNFVLTASFVASLARTAELSSGKVQTLATRLDHVEPEVRSEFSSLAGRLGQRAAVASRAHATTER